MNIVIQAVEKRRDLHVIPSDDSESRVHAVGDHVQVAWSWRPKHTISSDIEYSCVAHFTAADVARLFVEVFSDVKTGEVLDLIEAARSARQRTLHAIQKENEELYGTDEAPQTPE